MWQEDSGLFSEGRKEGRTNSGCVKSNMTHLPLPSSPQRRVGTDVVFKPHAGIIANRSNQQYGTTMGVFRCWLSFLFLRSAIMCLRGSRSSFHHPTGPLELPANVVAHEDRVALV